MASSIKCSSLSTSLTVGMIWCSRRLRGSLPKSQTLISSFIRSRWSIVTMFRLTTGQVLLWRTQIQFSRQSILETLCSTSNSTRTQSRPSSRSRLSEFGYWTNSLTSVDSLCLLSLFSDTLAWRFRRRCFSQSWCRILTKWSLTRYWWDKRLKDTDLKRRSLKKL